MDTDMELGEEDIKDRNYVDGEQWTLNYYGQYGENPAFLQVDDGSYGPKLVGQEVLSSYTTWFLSGPIYTKNCSGCCSK